MTLHRTTRPLSTRKVFYWLIKIPHRHLLMHKKEILVNLLRSLGLVVNWQKSQLITTREIDYLVAHFSFTSGSIVHKFLRLLGLMTACIDLVPLACLHMQSIQLYFLSLWQPHIDSLFALKSISQYFVIHLEYWTNITWHLRHE